ncbi:TRL domain-containing protein [Leptospira idonii]|uniref:TRL domain-containing protein n=1 Tax=Leptospira idonii TaxID=1193500 RepID=UPI0014384F2C|nr:TRL domain-containing protein [Leptospira idonii]
MIRRNSIFFCVLVLLCFCKCSTAGIFTPIGFSVYKDVKEPVSVGPSTSYEKSGEACAYNFGGFYVGGDFSLRKAMENGNITKPGLVDRSTFAIATIFAKVCTRVLGE